MEYLSALASVVGILGGVAGFFHWVLPRLRGGRVSSVHVRRQVTDDPAIHDLYVEVLENEAAIVNGLDLWMVDGAGSAPDDIVARRKRRPAIDGQMLVLVTAEIARAVRSSQEASDRYWVAIRNYTTTSGINGVDVDALWHVVQNARDDTHIALEDLKQLVRAEVRGS